MINNCTFKYYLNALINYYTKRIYIKNNGIKLSIWSYINL
jgi:hypothetical protein